MVGSFIIPKTIKFRLYNIVLLISNFYANIRWFCNIIDIILRKVCYIFNKSISIKNIIINDCMVYTKSFSSKYKNSIYSIKLHKVILKELIEGAYVHDHVSPYIF